MGVNNSSCVTTLLILLTVLSASVADNHMKSHFHQEIGGQSNNLTKGEQHTSTTTASSKDTTLETSTEPIDTSIDTSTTTALPDVTDNSNINGFQVIMYVFAIVGLTFSMICLIQIIRSSSYCDASSSNDSHSIDRTQRSWRRSWRGKSNRSYVFSDNIIAV